MHYLDLSDNTVLAPLARSLTIQDTRSGQIVQDAHFIYFRHEEAPSNVTYCPVLAVFRAGRLTPDGEQIEVESVELDYPHRAYGRKVLEGVATYPDGVKEEWRIQVDPVNMRFEWVRQPYNLSDKLFYRVLTSRRTASLQLWHTGSGLQVTNDVAATRGEPLILDAEQESELFFYSSAPKNCFRLETPSAGTLHIEGVTGVPVHLPGEAGWDYEAAEKRQQPLWDMRWVVEGSSLVRLSASWGIGAAHRDFLGRKEIHAADASADFGPFFTQMCLGCLTFNLLRTDGNGILPRASVVTGGEPEDVIAPVREIAWACEFLYLLDPKATAELLQDAIAWLAQRTCAQSPQANREMHNEEAALLLLMAGRYHKLTGDAKALKGHLPVLRTCGEHLLSLRREHEAMPIVHHTWDAQGVIQGKEPYFIALCFAGLQRLGSLEEALGDFSFAKAWTDAARAIQFAAISPFLDGGLWHAERSVFINYLDFRDPALASPHDQNWARSLLQMRPAIRQEYVHYETILPFWLELVEDPNQIQRAFEWIDGEYTYASGRGGATFPPFVQRNFVALVDVCLRQKHGIEGAARLLQLVLDRALDGGIPLTAAPFGAYSGSGPDTEAPGMFRHSRSGQFWDNSPFFALVLNIHYGLDYSHEGWHIGAPKPLENYPLSRVTNLCHKHAVYAITWQGRGRVKRITLDGKTYHDDVLRESEGEHEVVVFLT